MQYKGRKLKNKTRKRNGVVGRALPSNCKDGKQVAEEDTLSL